MRDTLPSPAARLDIDTMRAALAIAEASTVTLAANRLGRTPAAVSMQLKKLEETLGASLFNRTRHGMTPTPAGERLLPYARRMIETERAAREAFSTAPLAGRVHLGMIDDVGIVRLAQMLTAFARQHPKVTVDVCVAPTSQLTPKLDRGDLDLAVIEPGGSVAWRTSDMLLQEQPLVWAAPIDMEAWSERPLPLALAAEGCPWRRITLASLDDAGIPYRVAYESDFTTALVAAVQGGLAVSVLPASALPHGVRPVGEREGAPPLGVSRSALRLGAMSSPLTRALAARIAESFGAAGALATPPPAAAAPGAQPQPQLQPQTEGD